MTRRRPRATLFPYTTLFRSFTIYVPTSFPDREGELWWLGLEDVVGRSDSISFCIKGAERRIDCSTVGAKCSAFGEDRKSTRLNSSHVSISYAVFCLKKKKIN